MLKFSCWISIYLAGKSGVLEAIRTAIAAQAAIATVLRDLAAQTAELLLVSVLRIASAAQLIVGLVGLRVGPTKALLRHQSAEQRQETGAHLLARE